VSQGLLCNVDALLTHVSVTLKLRIFRGFGHVAKTRYSAKEAASQNVKGVSCEWRDMRLAQKMCKCRSLDCLFVTALSVVFDADIKLVQIGVPQVAVGVHDS